MKLEIEITREDYSNFGFYHFKKTQLVRTILIGLASLLILQFLFHRNKSSLNLGIILISSFLFIVFYSILIYFSLSKSRSIPKDDGSILGKKEYEFLDDHIFYKDKNSEGRFQWNAIKDVHESNKAFYLYLDTNMAILIPKKHFVDKTAEKNFGNYVRSKINVA